MICKTINVRRFGNSSQFHDLFQLGSILMRKSIGNFSKLKDSLWKMLKVVDVMGFLGKRVFRKCQCSNTLPFQRNEINKKKSAVDILKWFSSAEAKFNFLILINKRITEMFLLSLSLNTYFLLFGVSLDSCRICLRLPRIVLLMSSFCHFFYTRWASKWFSTLLAV